LPSQAGHPWHNAQFPAASSWCLSEDPTWWHTYKTWHIYIYIKLVTSHNFLLSSSEKPCSSHYEVYYCHPNETSALRSLHWLPIKEQINAKVLYLVRKLLKNITPQLISCRNTRAGTSFLMLIVPQCKRLIC
jgi:hypothetical protein